MTSNQKPVPIPPAWRSASACLRKAQGAEVRARWAAAVQDAGGASESLRAAAGLLRRAAEGMERAAAHIEDDAPRISLE